MAFSFDEQPPPSTGPPLRRGWTTGACATAAARAAYLTWVHGTVPKRVSIDLPQGDSQGFSPADGGRTAEGAWAAVRKDAGDDPDITHGALITVALRPGAAGRGLAFVAGPGVGTVTRPGLPLPVGEAAINPVPRRLIAATLQELMAQIVPPARVGGGAAPDLQVEIGVVDGERLAERTLNPRLGILGGLSILGTTGVVVPYSCSAWQATLRQALEVARANGCRHVIAATGRTSETAARRALGLPALACLEMGGFVDGLLAAIRAAPVEQLTLAGGFVKLAKLGQGHLDLRARRSRLDTGRLATDLAGLGAGPDLQRALANAETGLAFFDRAQAAGLAVGDLVAAQATAVLRQALDPMPPAVASPRLQVRVYDRGGREVGRWPGPGTSR